MNSTAVSVSSMSIVWLACRFLISVLVRRISRTLCIVSTNIMKRSQLVCGRRALLLDGRIRWYVPVCCDVEKRVRGWTYTATA